MLSPDQLKLKDLPRAVRGYSIPDTDEQIGYLLKQYTELYKEYIILKEKYDAASKTAENAEKDEESIRSALINAQKASSRITREANEKADVIIRSTKTACDKIMIDFRQAIAREKLKLAAVVEATDGFRERMLELHRDQMAQIEALLADDSYKDLLEDVDSFADAAVKDIKDNLAGESGTREADARDAASSSKPTYDGPEPLDLDKAYERRRSGIDDDTLEKPDQALFEEARYGSEIENNPNMTKTFRTVKKDKK